jgi:hypothetical protein
MKSVAGFAPIPRREPALLFNPLIFPVFTVDSGVVPTECRNALSE